MKSIRAREKDWMRGQDEGEGRQKDGSRKKRKVNISLFKACKS